MTPPPPPPDPAGSVTHFFGRLPAARPSLGLESLETRETPSGFNLGHAYQKVMHAVHEIAEYGAGQVGHITATHQSAADALRS